MDLETKRKEYRKKVIQDFMGGIDLDINRRFRKFKF